LRTFRLFPADALRDAGKGREHLIVIAHAISLGLGGVVGTEVAAVLAEMDNASRIYNHALGLARARHPRNDLPRSAGCHHQTRCAYVLHI